MYDLRFGRIQSLEYPQARIRNLKDRFQHTYIIGPTGCGKSTLMARMAVNDIRQGLATIFLDPKGDHLDDIYSLLSDDERERVVHYSYENPSLVLNPLRKENYDVYDLVDEFAEVMDIIIAQVSSTNPPASENMKEVLRETVPLLREEDREIEILYNFLRFEKFRTDYFRANYNGKKTPFWEKADKKIGGRMSDIAMTADRIAVRLGKLTKPEKFKKLFSGENQFYVEDIIREKKIFLIDTSGFTEEKLYYIVGLIAFGVKAYCRKREKVGEPLIFYFDECYMGINDSFIFSLPYARSSKVGFVLANQFVTQFNNFKLFDALLSQCSTRVVFTQRDVNSAKTMANALGVRQDDIRGLKKYEAWVNIFEKLSLVKTFPPELPEKKIHLREGESFNCHCDNDLKSAEFPQEIIDETIENKPVFLRDCWFSY